jgi:hypothetical protein
MVNTGRRSGENGTDNPPLPEDESMNQYEERRIATLIDGYFFTRTGEPDNLAFLRAKRELLSHLRDQIKNVELMDFNRWAFLRFPEDEISGLEG